MVTILKHKKEKSQLFAIVFLCTYSTFLSDVSEGGEMQTNTQAADGGRSPSWPITTQRDELFN